MAKATNDLKLELQRILRNAGDRRETLLGMAIHRTKLKKGLTIMSGVLALLSATAITTVLVKLVGNEGLQIVAAVTAALSGVMSLIISTYQDEETQRIFGASTAYLTMRDQVNTTLLQPELNGAELFSKIVEYQGEYARHDGLYSKYFSHVRLSAAHNFARQSSMYDNNQERRLSLFGRFMIAILPQSRSSRVPEIFLQRRTNKRTRR